MKVPMRGHSGCKSILQRKTRFNVTHLQMQYKHCTAPPPPPFVKRARQVDSTNTVPLNQRFKKSPGHVTTLELGEVTCLPLRGILLQPIMPIMEWHIKRGSNRFAGSFTFRMSVNIFHQIEINLWNTSDALSLHSVQDFCGPLETEKQLEKMCAVLAPQANAAQAGATVPLA
jgi:hypothetical protein